MEKERARLKALLRQKHRALLAIQEKLLKSEASEESENRLREEITSLRRKVEDARNECERLRTYQEEDVSLPSVSLPSAVISNDTDEEDVADESQDAEWKNMFHVVSNATKNVERRAGLRRCGFCLGYRRHSRSTLCA